MLGKVGLSINRTLAHWRNSHRSLPSAWQLTKTAAASYRQDWSLYVKILVVTLVPLSFIASYVVAPGEDSSVAAYASIANIIMNAALLLAVVRLAAGDRLNIKRAYYEGSGLFVRLFLLMALIALMIIPLLVGLMIFTAGVIESTGILALPEKVALGILAGIFAVPSLTMLTRAVFSFYVLAEGNKGPWEAVVASRRAVRGKALAVFGRLVALLVVNLLAIVAPALLFVFLSSYLQAIWPLFVMQVLVGLITLPFTNIYLYRLYQDLV